MFSIYVKTFLLVSHLQCGVSLAIALESERQGAVKNDRQEAHSMSARELAECVAHAARGQVTEC